MIRVWAVLKIGVTSFFFWGEGGWGPYDKDYRICGSILGPPCFRKLPHGWASQNHGVVGDPLQRGYKGYIKVFGV